MSVFTVLDIVFYFYGTGNSIFSVEGVFFGLFHNEKSFFFWAVVSIGFAYGD